MRFHLWSSLHCLFHLRRTISAKPVHRSSFCSLLYFLLTYLCSILFPSPPLSPLSRPTSKSKACLNGSKELPRYGMELTKSFKTLQNRRSCPSSHHSEWQVLSFLGTSQSFYRSGKSFHVSTLVMP